MRFPPEINIPTYQTADGQPFDPKWIRFFRKIMTFREA